MVTKTRSSHSPNGAKVYGDSLFPPTKPAAEMSDREYDFRRGAAQDVRNPRPLRPEPAGDEFVRVEPPIVPTVRRSPEMVAWLKQVHVQRRWDTFLYVVRSEHRLSELIETVWREKHGDTPISDHVVLTIGKEGTADAFFLEHLDILPHHAVDWNKLNRNYAYISLQHQPVGHWVMQPPSRGVAALEVVTEWLVGQRVERMGSDIHDPGIQSFVASMLGTKVSGEESLKWNSLLHRTAASPEILMALLYIRMVMGVGDDPLPDHVTLSARHFPVASGIFARDIELIVGEYKPDKRKTYLNFVHPPDSQLRYALQGTRGREALPWAKSWVSGRGHALEDTVEEAMAVAFWQPHMKTDRKAADIPWKGFTGYVSRHAPALYDHLVKRLNGHMPGILPRGEAIDLYARRFLTRKGYIMQWVALFPSSAPKKPDDIFAHMTVRPPHRGEASLTAGGGTGVIDLAAAYLQGMTGILIDHAVEKSVVARWLGTQSYTKEGPGLLWSGFLDYVASHPFPKLRQLYNAWYHTTSDELILGARQLDGDKKGEVYHVVVVPPDRVSELIAGSVRVHFKKRPGGQEKVWVEGNNHKDVEDKLGVIVPQKAGVTFAPDAKSDGVAQKFSLRPEIFVGDEVQHKPLVTPAEVMPVPQLTRPADAVDLPKLEGFQTTDPEAAKKIAATPPSNQIPVIPPKGAAAVIVVAAILVLADGPLPFLDAVAASYVGARLVLSH